MERRQDLGPRVAGAGHEGVEAELGHGRQKQVQPRVVAVVAGARRPLADGLGPHRLQAWCRPTRAAPLQALEQQRAAFDFQGMVATITALIVVSLRVDGVSSWARWALHWRPDSA